MILIDYEATNLRPNLVNTYYPRGLDKQEVLQQNCMKLGFMYSRMLNRRKAVTAMSFGIDIRL